METITLINSSQLWPSGAPFSIVHEYAQEVISGEFFKSDYEYSISPLNLRSLTDRRFLLKQGAEITVGIEPNGYVLSNDDLHVYASGETIFAATVEWENILIGLYLSYRDTPDNELTIGGKMLKDKLKRYVGEKG